MAGSINKAILIGHLGNDPEITNLNSGGQVARFRVATGERWTDKATGEKRERTEWHTVVIFNEGLVRVAEQYLRKGSKVYVEGQLATRKWSGQDGVERYSTEIVLRQFRGEITCSIAPRVARRRARMTTAPPAGGKPPRRPARASTTKSRSSAGDCDGRGSHRTYQARIHRTLRRRNAAPRRRRSC